jgi:hypothetical protein
MATPSPMNRGYSGGLAAGAPAGGGFRSSFQSSFSAPAAPMPRAPLPAMAPAAAPMPTFDPPAQAAPPPVDFSNMFGEQPQPFTPAPLPAPGQQSFNQPPPNPFGPQPLPFGGFRAEGGPVMPGQAYMVGERGPEMIVPQMPGMVLPNQSLTGRASASDGAVRSGPLSTRGATPVGSGRGMTPERRLEIAARRGDQRANLALFNAEQWGRGGRGPARALPPPMPMGRAPQAMTRPMPDFPPRSPAQQPQAPEPMAAPQFDLSNMLPPMAPGGAMAPLPPSTLMGGSGVPGPPAIDFRPLPGNPGYGVPVINGEVQRQFLPMPPSAEESGVQMTPVPGTNLRIPTMGGARVSGLPTFQEEMVPGSLVRRKTQGQPAPTQLTPQAENIAQMPKFQQDKDSGKMFYIEPNGQGGFRRKWVDEDGDGIVSPAEQAKAGAAGGRPVSPFVAAFGNQ